MWLKGNFDIFISQADDKIDDEISKDISKYLKEKGLFPKNIDLAISDISYFYNEPVMIESPDGKRFYSGKRYIQKLTVNFSGLI